MSHALPALLRHRNVRSTQDESVSRCALDKWSRVQEDFFHGVVLLIYADRNRLHGEIELNIVGTTPIDASDIDEDEEEDVIELRVKETLGPALRTHQPSRFQQSTGVSTQAI